MAAFQSLTSCSSRLRKQRLLDGLQESRRCGKDGGEKPLSAASSRFRNLSVSEVPVRAAERKKLPSLIKYQNYASVAITVSSVGAHPYMMDNLMAIGHKLKTSQAPQFALQ